MHPDDTHMNDSSTPAADPENGWWSKAIRQGGWDVGDKIVKVINCLSCGGLLVLTTNNRENYISDNDIKYVVDYRYYKKGHKNFFSEPFYCSGQPEDKLKIEQQNCNHEFIIILEPPTKSYNEYLSHIRNNDVIKEWLDWDKDLTRQMAYEMSITKNIVKWCWKCGVEKVFKEKLEKQDFDT
jgi:hypothetical protein